MPTVFDIVKQAGRIPVDELRWRASLPEAHIRNALADLKKLGLVAIRPGSDTETLASKGIDVVELTSKGMRQALG